MSKEERKDNLPFNEHELAQFIWTVREEKNVFGVKRANMLRLFSTLADEQEKIIVNEEIKAILELIDHYNFELQNRGTTPGHAMHNDLTSLFSAEEKLRKIIK